MIPMPKISPERKIAIAFIKVFRNNLDNTMKTSFVSHFGPDQASESIRFLFGKLGKVPDGLEQKLSFIYSEFNNDFVKFMKGMYDEILPQVICSTMNDIEEYLRLNFSEEEMQELALITEKKSVIKLLETGAFDILRRERLKFYDQLNESIHEYTERESVRERVQNAVQEFINNSRIDETPSDDDMGPFGPDEESF